MFNFKDCHKMYINLDHRTDRKLHMENELSRVGITAERFKAFKTNEHIWDTNKTKVMQNRTPGAIGCHYSQVEVMKIALENKKSAFVMEDDLVFCDDFYDRMQTIEKFLNNNLWDVFWLGGTFHVNPPVWHTGKHPNLLESNFGKDVQCTHEPRILKTYGCWSTYAYIVNINSIEKVTNLLDKYVHESMGIDWLFIKLGLHLNTYCYVPGCVKQLDNKSDIGKGTTMFSAFSKLGPFWWQQKKEQFDPTTFNWGEAKYEERGV